MRNIVNKKGKRRKQFNHKLFFQKIINLFKAAHASSMFLDEDVLFSRVLINYHLWRTGDPSLGTGDVLCSQGFADVRGALDLVNAKILGQHLNSQCHREENVSCINAGLNGKKFTKKKKS